MAAEPQNDSLDQYVDYIRHVVIVILAAGGAYFTIVTKEEILFPWAIFLIFSATVYALFLPYKRAILITDEWKDVGRFKALGLLFGGIPLYLVPAFLMLISESYSNVLPLAQSYFVNWQIPDAFWTIFSVVPPFLMGGLLASVFMNFPFLSLLGKTGIDKNEIQDIKNYGGDGSYALGVLGFAEIMIVALLYLSAGWAHPESLNIYTLGTIIMILQLIAFGHLYVRCFPSALENNHRRVLNFLFVVLILLSSLSIYMTIVCNSIAFFVLYYIYHLSEENLHILGSPQEFLLKKKKEAEGRDIVTYTFYKLHPRISFSTAFLILLWSVYIVFTFSITLNISIIGIVIACSIYWTIPRIWLKINSQEGL